MYLKALEIQGFKSFPDKTVLTFSEDITAIVGPNGSGKSNISDAIRWVMGEQSTRALRGGKMEDVIFGGTAKRKQTGYAEVSLVLDNTGHLFDVDESEVMVTRRYYRSGESEYYINRRSVRLKDINELFMDTGLGKEGYSIIGQGKIDEILSVKSGDRREVFEEAAGISRFRHRKEESERKLERTEENLVRINDKISELELQVDPLREQSEKAKKFLLFRDELKGLEISVWLDTLERLRANSIKYETDYQNAAAAQVQLKEHVESMYEEIEKTAEIMREKEMEIEDLRSQGQAQEAAAAQIESDLAVLRTTIANNEENAKRIETELAQKTGQEGDLSAQIDENKKQRDVCARSLEEVKQQLDEKKNTAQALSQSAGMLATELESLRKQEAMESATSAEAKALLSALAAAQQEILDRDEALRQQMQQVQTQKMQVQEEKKHADDSLTKAQEEKDAVQNVIGGYQLRADARRKKADELAQREIKLKMDDNALKSRIQMLSEMEKAYEGFGKAVRLVMSEAKRGTVQNVHGPVADLLSVEGRYTLAIETALGGAMQNIVVDSDSDGKQVIEFLKRRDGGRVTILPISSVRTYPFQEKDAVSKERGFVGLGDTLVSFDAKYQPVMTNLLGRVVVMENMDCAIALARKFGYKFKIVTLDGQVLHAGGSMTGGSANRSAGILSRKEELEALKKQQSQIGGDLQQVELALETARREVTAADYEMETARAQLRQWEDAVLSAQGECARVESILQGLADQLFRCESELAQLKHRSEQNEKDTQSAQNRIAQLEGSAAALKSQAEGKAQGQSDLQLRASALSEEISALSAQMAGLESQLSSAEQNLAQLEHLRENMKGDQAQSRLLMGEFAEKNRQILQQIEQRNASLLALREDIAKKQEAMRTLGEEKLQMEGKRNQAQRDNREKNEQLLRMEREVSALEQKKVSSAMEEKQILDKLWDNYELSHEAAKAHCIEVESMPKATRRIGELRRMISALGNVNVGAIEEFQRVNERFTYLSDQRDDVQAAKKELETIIAQITQEMKTIFRREFDVINDAFGHTFVELFGGGKATLELEDPEDILNCGIEIRVQPPGKALKIISLLSGGEKAFVAIALYFAILKVRPTPFVVMDEIEAALDDNNVVRFARYLRDMADKTQFIVITHRRGTMEEADVLYGVTMQEQGISRMLTINLNDVEKELNIR